MYHPVWSGLTPGWTFGGTVEAGAAGADTAAVARERADVVVAVKGEDLAFGIHAAHGLALAFVARDICAHGVTVATANLKAVIAAWKSTFMSFP